MIAGSTSQLRHPPSAATENSEGDLVHNSMTSDGFCENSDHKAEHCNSSIQKFSFLEALRTDLSGSGFLKPTVG